MGGRVGGAGAGGEWDGGVDVGGLGGVCAVVRGGEREV